MSATPNPAAWRPRRSNVDFAGAQRGAGGPHKAVVVVDQPGAVQVRERVNGARWVAAQLALDLHDRPRPLSVRVEQHREDGLFALAFFLGGGTGTLVVHRDLPPGATTPGRPQPARGSICRDVPTVGFLSAERKEFRQAFRQPLLEELRTQEAELSLQSPQGAAPMPTQAELAAVADQLERVIATAQPQQAKALLRILIAGLCVNGKADIRPTYRVTTPDEDAPLLAGVRPTSGKVETVGVEPTSAVA